MGLFGKRMPTLEEKLQIDSELTMLNSYNNGVTRVDDVGLFLSDVESIKEIVGRLIKYERKYPYYFNPKPSQILNSFSTSKLVLEKGFIDRYIMAIERKLLDYSTMRGKTNNFNKMVDVFRYYSGEFEPENVNYFEIKLKERFSDFYK